MTLNRAQKNRGITRDITIQDATGKAIEVGKNDKIRAIIGHEGRLGTNLSDAKLVVSSDAATSNGSSFTKNSPSADKNRLRLDASDLDFDPGLYTLFIDYFDNADAQEWKTVDRQVFYLEDT